MLNMAVQECTKALEYKNGQTRLRCLAIDEQMEYKESPLTSVNVATAYGKALPKILIC